MCSSYGGVTPRLPTPTPTLLTAGVLPVVVVAVARGCVRVTGVAPVVAVVVAVVRVVVVGFTDVIVVVGSPYVVVVFAVVVGGAAALVPTTPYP